MCVLYVWVLAANLIPRNPAHIQFGPVFVAGLILGVFLYHKSRKWIRHEAVRKRRILHLGSEYDENNFNKNEDRIYKMLLNGSSEKSIVRKIEPIRKKLLDRGKDFDGFLRLVRISLYRACGDFEKSNSDLPKFPVTDDPIPPDEIYLLLVRLLNQLDDGELGPEECLEKLNLLIAENPQDTCPQVLASQSLRTAELEIVPHEASVLPRSQEALEIANTALESKHKRMDGRHGMNLSAPKCFFRDVVGTSLLAAGLSSEASLYLYDCIREDPDYSAAYIHLGDLFWYRHHDDTSVAPSGRSYLFHAEVCYRVAQSLEGDGASNHNTRRAQARLDRL